MAKPWDSWKQQNYKDKQTVAQERNRSQIAQRNAKTASPSSGVTQILRRLRGAAKVQIAGVQLR